MIAEPVAEMAAGGPAAGGRRQPCCWKATQPHTAAGGRV